MVYVYVLQGTTGKRYVGITKNLARRLMEHRSKSSKGGQILGNFILLIKEEYPDYASAREREKYLKSGQGREYLETLHPRTWPASGG
jgi:putative endonuclease